MPPSQEAASANAMLYGPFTRASLSSQQFSLRQATLLRASAAVRLAEERRPPPISEARAIIKLSRPVSLGGAARFLMPWCAACHACARRSASRKSVGVIRTATAARRRHD